MAMDYVEIQSVLDYPPPSESEKCWRIIERGGESRAIGLRKFVPMGLVADSECGGQSMGG